MGEKILLGLKSTGENNPIGFETNRGKILLGLKPMGENPIGFETNGGDPIGFETNGGGGGSYWV